MTASSVAFDYVESGSGPAVLFLPGSFGTAAGWRAVLGHLGSGYRTVTTSLLGYGATAERRPTGNTSMTQQVDVIDEIIERIGTSPHVVGHSYGGLSALAHALSGRLAPASLLLVEANPLGLLQVSGDFAHYAMFEAMTGPYFAAVAGGESDAARRVIDFYGGAGAFEAMPTKARESIVATTSVNVCDWSSGMSFAPTKAQLQAIAVPTTVVRGGSSHPAMQRIAERLHEAIPRAELVTIADGSHFLPTSHPAEIASLVRQQVERVG